MNPLWRFYDLASWACTVLDNEKINQVAPWRMLEYWMQVELYRQAVTRKIGGWMQIGEFE